MAEARIALREDKGGVDDAVSKVPDYLKDNPGLLYERMTWRRRHDNDEGAIKLLEKIASMENISSQSRWWKERNILARHLINEKEYKRAYDLPKPLSADIARCRSRNPVLSQFCDSTRAIT